jgi:hypothetical protein
LPEVALLLTSTTVIVLAGFLLTVLMRPTGLGEVVVGTVAMSIAVIEVDSLLVGGLLASYRPGPLLLGAFGLLVITATPLLTRQGRLSTAGTVRLLGTGLGNVRHGVWRQPTVLLLGMALIAAYGVRAYLSVRLPNTDSDGLLYHLVGIDEWITQSLITHNSLVMWADVYPQSVELFVGWTCVHLHTTIYAAVSQLPIFVIGAASVAGLARRIGARRSHAVLAGLVFLATPAVMAQFGTNFVDAAAASLGLAALYLVLGLKRAVDANPDSPAVWAWRLATVSMVAGLASAAKSSNLVLAPFLVAYVIAVQWNQTDTSASTAERLRLWVRRGWSGPPGVLFFGTAALAIGGYWYLRTWIKYGNPLYPFTVAGLPGLGSVDDVIIAYNTPEQLAGRNVLQQIALSWGSDFEPSHTVLYDQRLGGLGMQWVFILVPLGILATLVWWRGGRRGPTGFLVLIIIGVMITSPAPWWARYVLIIAGLAAALSATALTWVTGRFQEGQWNGAGIRRGGIVRAVASVAMLGVVGTSMWWATRSLPYAEQGGSSLLSLRSALDLAARDDRMSLVYPWFLYRAIDQVPRGAKIAVISDGIHRFTHPLFGNDLEHDVVAIGPVRSVDQLRTAMSRRNLSYVFLDGTDAAVTRAAIDDKARFRLLNRPTEVHPGPFYLFEYCDASGRSREDQRCISG